jgi:hypothetical protein
VGFEGRQPASKVSAVWALSATIGFAEAVKADHTEKDRHLEGTLKLDTELESI